MKYSNISLFIILVLTTVSLLITGCSDSKNNVAFTQATSSPEDLTKHTEIFKKRIEKVSNNIYVAIGYGLANSIMIEGPDSVVIIDCMESMKSAAEVKKAFDSITKKPVAAIVYTHFHTDHTSGAKALAGNSSPAVYSQELLPHYLDQTAAVVRDITEKRAYRMYGVFLEYEAMVNCGIGPHLAIDEHTTFGVLRPTVTFKDSLSAKIAGIQFKFYHTPGETPDQLCVWLPEQKILFPGDNIYKTFPNLYTIRGTAYRDVNVWKNSLDKMRYMYPSIIVPSHTIPIVGKEKIYSILTDYRDAIQFVHDQTVKGMNRGLTPNELVETVILPEHLQKSEWLKEFYGKTQWSVRTVFDGYLGFFDGNPTTLLPLKMKEKAERMEKLAGGKSNLMASLEEASKSKDYKWVLELSDVALTLYPEDKKVKTLRMDALTALGMAESNPPARHYYLASALELSGVENKGLITPTSDLVNDIPLSAIFNGMAAHLNAEKSIDVNKKALFIFTDNNEKWTVEVRKGVAEIQPFVVGKPDITIKVNSLVWKEMAAKIRNPTTTFLSGAIDVDGGQMEFIKFMKLFDIDE
jgi:alkyl sulfatase BDS1-like metallo-beta-lactamase superfamily hydrolase